MSIATVVTGGFGSFGTIAEVVTFGYSIGEAVAVTRTGAGAFTDDEILDLKLRQRLMLARLPASKLSTEEMQLLAELANQLRQLQELPQLIEEPELEDELEEAVTQALEAPERRELEPEGQDTFTAEQAPEAPPSLAKDIEALKDTIQRIIQAREEAEEDDMEVLLMVMH